MSDHRTEKLLAECLEWMKKHNASAAEAAARYPSHADELLELLETYNFVRDAKKPALRPEFEANARLRLQNRIAAKEQSVTKKTGVRRIWQINKSFPIGNRRFAMSWLLVIGLVATMFAGGGGAAYASADALPGDMLYPVKTMLHDAELAFSGDAKDAELLLSYMYENVGEVQQLAAQARYGDMMTGLEEYQENMQALKQTQTRLSYEDTPAAESLNNRVQEQLQTCLQLLTQLQEQIRDQVKDQLKLQDKLQQAIQLTETGAAYGPNDGGQPEEPGTPNGAGPGEPQGAQEGNGPGTGNEDAGQGGQPEDAGNGAGSGAGNENPGTGEGNEAPGTGPGSGPGEQGGNGDGDGICDQNDGECDGTGDGGEQGGSGGNGQGGKP